MMQTFNVIVQRNGGFEFVDNPKFETEPPSTYVVNELAEIYVYWQGRSETEMTNADALVIPVHEMLMDIAIGRNGKVM